MGTPRAELSRQPRNPAEECRSSADGFLGAWLLALHTRPDSGSLQYFITDSITGARFRVDVDTHKVTSFENDGKGGQREAGSASVSRYHAGTYLEQYVINTSDANDGQGNTHVVLERDEWRATHATTGEDQIPTTVKRLDQIASALEAAVLPTDQGMA